MIEARKITFQDAWNSTSVFFIDDGLENEIDTNVSKVLEISQDHRVSDTAEITEQNITDFLYQKSDGLNVILRDIGLSEEKFMRIISLLRKLGQIPGEFDREWNIEKIKGMIRHDKNFANKIAKLLVDGKRDKILQSYIPRYYLDMLNYREIKGQSQSARRVRFKELMIGTYGARKGHKVEEKIREKLEEVKIRYGIDYNKGRSILVETDIDFAIPNVEDPWVIIMSSFQETTSSAQTTKAKDMLSAYERICRINSRYNENRAFVNFVDGGGWLSRKRDPERLVEHCHYFVNLNYLDMLESIILKHISKKYFAFK